MLHMECYKFFYTVLYRRPIVVTFNVKIW